MKWNSRWNNVPCREPLRGIHVSWSETLTGILFWRVEYSEIPGNIQQGYETFFQMGQTGEQIVNENLTLLSLYANNLARDGG